MTRTILFGDRPSAGRELAELVSLSMERIRQQEGIKTFPIVYALPRGGIPVAIPIARRLDCPLDVIPAKKITVPTNRELAIGAVTSEDHILLAEQKQLQPISLRELGEAIEEAQLRANRQQAQFAPYRPALSPKGKIAILVDDGIATGMTIRVAAQAIKEKQVARLWLCAPVAPPALIPQLELECGLGLAEPFCGRVVVAATPSPFASVGLFYKRFEQVATQEALTNLQQYNQQFFSRVPTEPSGQYFLKKAV
ncbi:phosphoribosyltransferase [Pleurocapsales cyanobacterium LEGE 06147]|nr:phosphoribosyltransferase [Pleurocapsales cyanobacterium LEGE 06147]